MTGKTYLLRREIKSLGGKWNKEKEGWLIPANKLSEAQELEKNNQVEVVTIEIDFDPFKPMTTEELRANRQAKADRKADRLIKRAENREQQAKSLNEQTTPYMSDIAFVTQPITNNSGGRSFQRFREKVYNKIDKEFILMNEADDLRERAASIRNNVSVKGDSARRRQDKRDANDEVIKIGSKIMDFAFGSGEVVKINKLTYTILWERSGHKFTRDKSFVVLRDSINK